VGCNGEKKWGLLKRSKRGEEKGLKEVIDEGLDCCEEGVVNTEC
jgi:hypothetical protein